MTYLKIVVLAVFAAGAVTACAPPEAGNYGDYEGAN